MTSKMHCKFVFPCKIADLQASYEKSVAEKERLTHNIEETQARLKRAAKLTTGLADEQVRWAESVKVRLVTTIRSRVLIANLYQEEGCLQLVFTIHSG